jgi:hypothetical protein
MYVYMYLYMYVYIYTCIYKYVYRYEYSLYVHKHKYHDNCYDQDFILLSVLTYVPWRITHESFHTEGLTSLTNVEIQKSN